MITDFPRQLRGGLLLPDIGGGQVIGRHSVPAVLSRLLTAGARTIGNSNSEPIRRDGDPRYRGGLQGRPDGAV